MQNQINNINRQKNRSLTISVLITAIILLIGTAVCIGAVAISGGNSSSRDYNRYDGYSATEVAAAKISIMESDTATMNMLIKEAINTSKASITTWTYNGKTAAQASIRDICLENNMGIDGTYTIDREDGYNFFSRTINGKEYRMVWQNNSVVCCGPDDNRYGDEIDASTMIRDIDPN